MGEVRRVGGKMYEIKLGGGKGRSEEKKMKKMDKWGQGKEGKCQAKDGVGRKEVGKMIT
jgi:hypothetical protein